MADVTFTQMLNRTARLCGLDPARLPVDLAASLAAWLEDRVAEAWRATVWPETCGVDERTVETDPDEADAYEVALASPIGEVLDIWQHDPRLVDAPTSVPFLQLDGEAVRLTASTPETVYVRYRRPAPRFTTGAWSDSDTYSAGDLVHYSDGHCYLATAAADPAESPETNPEKWERQGTPEVLAHYAQRAARADWLAEDGQDDKAAAQMAIAQKWLTDRMADLLILRPNAGHYFVT